MNKLMGRPVCNPGNSIVSRAGRARCVRNSSGFTALECILVVLIMGMMLAIALPRLQEPLAHYRLYAAGREMVSHIRELQQRALTEEKTSYKIKFHRDASGVIKIDKYHIMDGIKSLQVVELPPGLNLYTTTFTDHTLPVSNAGFPEYGFGGTIFIDNDYQERVYVIVSKNGRVRMDSELPAL